MKEREKDTAAISRRIAGAIRESGLSGAEIARLTGKNRVTAVKWKNGESITVSAADLWQLSRILKRPAEWFVTGCSAGPDAFAEYFRKPELRRAEDGTFTCLFTLTEETVPLLAADSLREAEGADREKCAWIRAGADVPSVMSRGDIILAEMFPALIRDRTVCQFFSPVNGVTVTGELRLCVSGGCVLLCQDGDVTLTEEELRHGVRAAWRALLVCRTGPDGYRPELRLSLPGRDRD